MDTDQLDNARGHVTAAQATLAATRVAERDAERHLAAARAAAASAAADLVDAVTRWEQAVTAAHATHLRAALAGV